MKSKGQTGDGHGKCIKRMKPSRPLTGASDQGLLELSLGFLLYEVNMETRHLWHDAEQPYSKRFIWIAPAIQT